MCVLRTTAYFLLSALSQSGFYTLGRVFVVRNEVRDFGLPRRATNISMYLANAQIQSTILHNKPIHIAHICMIVPRERFALFFPLIIFIFIRG